MNKVMIVISLCFVFFACGEKENSGELKNENSGQYNEDYYKFSKINIKKHGIMATIMLPNETAGIGTAEIPEVIHVDSDFRWELKVGSTFSLFIEDFGVNNTLINKMTEKLKAQSNVYTINYITKSPRLLVYEKTIKKRESTSNKQKKTYHIYGQKKIDNIIYEIKNSYNGNSKDVVLYMQKSIGSIKSIKK